MSKLGKPVSGFYKAYFCTDCDSRLSIRQVGYSNGMCPECGASANGTFVRTYTKKARKYWTPKWYNPFSKTEVVG